MKNLTNRILMLLALFILVSYVAFSKPISSEEAKDIAMQHNLQMNKYSVELQDPSAYKLIASSHDIFTNSTQNPTFYIYNFPQKGWVIVAGDDIARPILAYSKEASYSLENIPDNSKYWLEIYDNAISEAIKQGAPQSEKIANEWLIARNPKKRASLLDEVVPPLIKTKWGQEAPYNDLCPYDEDAGKRTLTGCVATTMAQIMKYWNFPVSGKGKYTYGHGLYGKLSADFENTTYDWDNMANEYNQNSSKEEIKAVATLMYHCGVALSMHYGVESSGTEEYYIVSSLKTYFLYDNSIKLIHRSDYDDNTWTNILKENLDNHQPMPYAGEANAIRHSFICDGYDTDGRFHFNLGWNGNSNGYYYIDNITHLELNLNQNVIINIEPVEEFRPKISLLKPLELKQEIVYQNSSIKINANIVNNKVKSFSGSLSLRLFDAEDNFLMTVAEQEINNLEPNKPIEITFETNPLFNISAGKYYVKLYYKHDILNSWLLSSGHNKLVLDIKKTNTESKLSLYSLPILSAYQIEKDSTLKVTASFINTSEEDFRGIILASIYDEKGTMIKELASYNVTEVIAPNDHIKDIEFSNIISNLDYGIYFIGFRSKDEGGEFAFVNTNGLISFIKFAIVLPELITDLQLKKWIKSNRQQLFGVVVNEDGGITDDLTNLEALAKIENLNCSNFNLVSIDELIRHMPNLKTLKCYRNSLIELDVSKNIKLEEFDCSDNQLKNLDVSNSIELIYLKCNHNQLINLNINNNIKLEALHCFRNSLNKLDVTNNIKLVELGCFENKLTKLDISKNINLGALHCYSNQLKNLDVSKNINLYRLHSNNNQLTSLDISLVPNLQYLKCCNQAEGFILYLTNKQKNRFNEKDYCNAILYTEYAQLITDSKLKNWIKSNTQQLPEVVINADGGIIGTKTNLEALAKIETLECSNSSSLVSIDELIRHMPSLKTLLCNNNSLIELDVSKNIKLETLYCYNNQLTSLYIAPLTNLTKLNCCNQAEGFILYLTDEQKSKFTQKDYCDAILSTDFLIKDSRLKKWIKSNEGQLSGVVINADGGIISTITNLEALAKIDSLNCTHFNLVSIDELIRHMPNLKTLKCDNNSLIELDLSKNIELTYLKCACNKLTNLDVSKNIKLKELYCWSNQLSNLDVGKNTELTSLICTYNQLTNLDLSKNIKLKELYCYKNRLNKLSITKNIGLEKLYCSHNRLNNLYMSKNVELIYLECSYNQLTNLDMSNNIKLKELYCNNNQLNNLYVGENTELTYLNCSDNQLTNLDVSKNIKLKELYCNNNQLNNLDIVSIINLIRLDCFNNQLRNLDVSKNINLIQLGCFENKLTDLDMSNNTKLEALYCYKNQLTNLDMSNNTKLEALYCYKNQLTNLDVSNNIKLKELHCDNNKLINLDLSKNLELTSLKCNNNLLADLDVSNNVNLETLHCSDNQLNNLDISNSIELTFLKCNHNQLTNLGVSKNIKLKELHCFNNQLINLDVSKNINLIQLGCFENELTNLGVSKNIKLEALYCYKNQLNNLDLSSNIKLRELYCDNNQLTSLNIISLTSLTKLNCCNQAEGFILYLTNEQKSKFTVANYCNAILKEKDGSICEIEWLDIYPNPTSGKFFIESKFFTDEIKILNLAGEVLYRAILNDEKTEIDISNLPAGLYLVITKGKIGKVVKN